MNNTQTIVRTNTQNLSRIATFLGPAFILALGLPLDRKKYEATFLATDPIRSANGDTLVGQLKTVGVADTVDLKTDRIAQVGSIIRRNGYYGMVADPRIKNAIGFQGLVDAVRTTDPSHKLAAFDTVYSHTRNPKVAWLGRAGKEAKLLTIDGQNVIAMRFCRAGLIAIIQDDSTIKFVTWNDINTWLNGGDQAITYTTVYTLEGQLVSLSHVNTDDIVVVNSDRAKYVLSLTDVSKPDIARATLIQKNTSQLTAMYVGSLDGTGFATTVDDLVDDGGQRAIVRYGAADLQAQAAQA